VIVVVEGPSASGKTTWCREHAPAQTVEEYQSDGQRRVPPDGEAAADYWASVNSGRWREAQELESRAGLAVCDTDPLKLHYAWCLAWVGVAPAERFHLEAAATRRAVTSGRLGFADLVLLADPDPSTLATRRAGDPTRRRRNFGLHRRLGEPLRQWYLALDSLDRYHRVVWELPADGLSTTSTPPRSDRCDVALLDVLLDALPRLPE
jgi:nicotinamide riboside kinase